MDSIAPLFIIVVIATSLILGYWFTLNLVKNIVHEQTEQLRINAAKSEASKEVELYNAEIDKYNAEIYEDNEDVELSEN